MLSLWKLRVESQCACCPAGAVCPFLLADACVPWDRHSSSRRIRRRAPLAFLHKPHVRDTPECGGENGDGYAGAGNCEVKGACCGYHEERRCKG